MIEASQQIIDETPILGGKAALLQVTMWEPNQNEAQFKFKISAVDYNGEFLHDWEFTNEDEAKRAFADLSARAIC